MKNDLILFEDYKIRRLYDEATKTWYFSVVDIIQVLTQQPNFQRARNYWKVLKSRLNKEGNESVTKCNRLKLVASDGKKYLTDVANVETVLRLIQSITTSAPSSANAIAIALPMLLLAPVTIAFLPSNFIIHPSD